MSTPRQELEKNLVERNKISSPPSRPCSFQHQRNDSSARSHKLDRISYNAEPYIKTTQPLKVAMEGGEYPEELNPFAGDAQYPEELNPFSDEEEWLPDVVDPFRENNNSNENGIPEENVQIHNSEVETENDNSKSIISQEFSPLVIVNRKLEIMTRDAQNKEMQKAPTPPPNPDKIEKMVFIDSALDHSKDSINDHEEPEKDKNENKNSQSIFEELKPLLHDGEKTEASSSESSFKTADPGDSEGETNEYKNDIDGNIIGSTVTDNTGFVTSLENITDDTKNNFEATITLESNNIEKSVKETVKMECLVSSPPVIENNVESSVTDNTGVFTSMLSPLDKQNCALLAPSLEKKADDNKNNCKVKTSFETNNMKESVKKSVKIECLLSSPPVAKNHVESSIVQNSGLSVSSVRPSRKKRPAPLPPPLQNPEDKMENFINVAQTSKSNEMKRISATSLSRGVRNSCGEEIKKKGAFQVNADMSALKPTRPAPPIPIQHLQKPETRRKGVRGILKRIFCGKK